MPGFLDEYAVEGVRHIDGLANWLVPAVSQFLTDWAYTLGGLTYSIASCPRWSGRCRVSLRGLCMPPSWRQVLRSGRWSEWLCSGWFPVYWGDDHDGDGQVCAIPLVARVPWGMWSSLGAWCLRLGSVHLCSRGTG